VAVEFAASGRTLSFAMPGELRLHARAAALCQASLSERGRWRADGVLQYISGSRRMRQPVVAPVSALDAPHGEIEQALADVWAELLGVKSVRRSDNFFELGGTSLLAMQAVAAMEARTARYQSPKRYPYDNLAQLAVAYATGDVALKASVPGAVKAGSASGGLVRRLFGTRRRAN
jgi:hypothetical protein